MNDFFEQIFYEYPFLYNGDYTTALSKNSFFINLGLLMIVIPIVIMAVFYFINKYPYGKLWHWLIAWVVSGALVAIISYNLLNEELAVYILSPSEFPDAGGFVMNLVWANLVYSLVVGFIISFVYKQVPGPQSTLPFRINKK
jgi:hypothetical protein